MKKIIYTLIIIATIFVVPNGVKADACASTGCATCVYKTTTQILTYKVVGDGKGSATVDFSYAEKEEHPSTMKYIFKQNIVAANFISKATNKIVCPNLLYSTVTGTAAGQSASMTQDLSWVEQENSNAKYELDKSSTNNGLTIGTLAANSLSCDYNASGIYANIKVTDGVLGTPTLSNSKYLIGNNTLTVDLFKNASGKLACPNVELTCGCSGDNCYCTFFPEGTTPGEATDGNVSDTADEINDTTPPEDYTPVNGCAILGENITPMIRWAINLIKILIPLLIIVLTIVEFTKIVISADEKEYKTAINHLIKRLIIGVVIFLLPTIIALLIDLSGILKQYGITDDLFCSLFK